MQAMRWQVLLTCEHGGNEVPEEYRALFDGMEAALASHRGWDPGALSLARWLGRRLSAPVVASTVTRLLVDLNRSAHNPRVFSEATRRLSREERERLLARFHAPHRAEVAEAVARAAAVGAVAIRNRAMVGRVGAEEAVAHAGRAEAVPPAAGVEAGSLAARAGAEALIAPKERTVLHLGIHSFTPELRGEVRRADMALLYDPSRARERALCVAWTEALRRLLPGRHVRRNYPYRGRSDGLTTSLRAAHGEEGYLGIEIEVNQKHVGRDGAFPPWVGEALGDGLEEVLAGWR